MASRLLTINIRNYLVKQPRRKRPARMPRYVRYKIARAVKMRLEDVRITKELNSLMLKRNLHSMMPLKVSISVEKDRATAMPFAEKQAAVKAAAQTGRQVRAGGPAAAQKQDVKGAKDGPAVASPKDSAK
jgi:ribosomal protein L31E